MILTSTPSTQSHLNIEQNTIESVTALTKPVIDGIFTNSINKEYLGEWDDARHTSEQLFTSDGFSITFEMYQKMVGDQLFMAILLPSDIQTIDITTLALQVDRDNDNLISKGDIQLRLQRYGNMLKGIENDDVDQYMDVYIYDSVNWKLIDTQSVNGGPMTLSWGKMVLSHNKFDSKLPTIVELTIDLFRIDQDLSNFPTNRKNHGNTFTGDYETLRYGLIIKGENNLDFSFPIPTQTEYVAEYTDIIYDIPPPNILPTRDLWIEDIDVMQTTINLDDTIRVVQGKQTLVRVFVGQDTGKFVKLRVILTIYESFFFSARYLKTMILSNDVPPTIHKQQFSSSFNFEIPAKYTNTSLLLFNAVIDDVYDSFWDPTPENNSEDRVQFFDETTTMNIFVIPVNKAHFYQRPILPQQAEIDVRTTYTEYMLPSGLVNFYQIPWQMLGSISENSSDSLKSNLKRVYDQLLSSRSRNIRAGSPYIRYPHQLVGITPYGVSDIGGSSDPSWGLWGGDGIVSWVVQNSGGGGTTMLHEINHNLGPSSWGHHVTGDGYGCGAPDGLVSNDGDWNSLYGDNIIHDLGWNPNDGLINVNTPELMTYCLFGNEPSRWIGEYRWNLLYTRMQSLLVEVGSTTSGPLQLNQEQIQNSFRMISGYITTDGNGVIDPSFEIVGAINKDKIEIPNPEAYLKVSYFNGTISTIPIRVNFRDIENNSMATSYFYKSVVDNGEIISITLHESGSNKKLYSTETLNYDTFANLQYPGFVKRDEEFEVFFNLDSNNYTNLYSQLYYSPDGNGYYPISGITTSNSVTLTMVEYPGGSSHFKLLVSDGFTTNDFTGSTLSIEHLPPKVSIKQNIKWDRVNNISIPLRRDMEVTVGETVNFEITSQDEYGWDLPFFTYEILNLETYVSETRFGKGKYADIRITKSGSYSITVTGSDPRTSLQSSDIIFVTVNPFNDTITLNQALSFYDDLDKARVNYGLTDTSQSTSITSKSTDSTTPQSTSDTTSKPTVDTSSATTKITIDSSNTNNPLPFLFEFSLIAIITLVYLKSNRRKY